MAVRRTMSEVVRRVVVTACVALTVTSSAASSFDDAEFTRWNVRTCPGLEALVFIGALSGNKVQHDHYRSEVKHIRSQFDDESLAALERLAEVAEISGMLIGPNLALLFSAGPVNTLDDVILSAQQPEARLRPNLEKSKYWDTREWEWFRDETIPDVLTVLLDESSTQALEQIVANRMGFGWGPGARWRTTDGGMHMLAAAIYQMLREDGFDRTGGHFSEWLVSAIESGMFTPEDVKRRAALVVGQPAVDRWPKETQTDP